MAFSPLGRAVCTALSPHSFFTSAPTLQYSNAIEEDLSNYIEFLMEGTSVQSLVAKKQGKRIHIQTQFQLSGAGVSGGNLFKIKKYAPYYYTAVAIAAGNNDTHVMANAYTNNSGVLLFYTTGALAKYIYVTLDYLIE